MVPVCWERGRMGLGKTRGGRRVIWRTDSSACSASSARCEWLMPLSLRAPLTASSFNDTTPRRLVPEMASLNARPSLEEAREGCGPCCSAPVWGLEASSNQLFDTCTRFNSYILSSRLHTREEPHARWVVYGRPHMRRKDQPRLASRALISGRALNSGWHLWRRRSSDLRFTRRAPRSSRWRRRRRRPS